MSDIFNGIIARKKRSMKNQCLQRGFQENGGIGACQKMRKNK